MEQKFNTVQSDKVIFLDIETVPQAPTFDQISEPLQQLWTKKANYLDANKTASELFQRAGIYAEFGKIICISIAYINTNSATRELRVTSFANHDENALLQNFLNLIYKHFNTPDYYLCAHNGKEFDFPFIARRLLINRLPIPQILDARGIKPWEVRHFDTMELWRFGDYKQHTSLDLLTTIFNIPSPKTDMNGADVCKVYWNDDGLERIIEYCQADVVAVAQLWSRYRNDEIFSDDEIKIVPQRASSHPIALEIEE